VTPRDVYCGPDGAVAKIRAIQSWFESQRSLVFFAASIIIVYEGAATRPEDVNVAVRFIDFAHSFPSKGKQDENVLPGVTILAGLLERVGEGQAA
jgi:1D-myo-inositol-tetrakisphosphate 5-kinase/inositol-polyphosphate multikinase